MTILTNDDSTLIAAKPLGSSNGSAERSILLPHSCSSVPADKYCSGLNDDIAKSGKRLPGLDVLRGLAILLVLFAHGLGPDESGAFYYVAAVARTFGPSGVDLFFVLSGFLVGGLLLSNVKRSGDFSSRRFIARRGFKIWPSYYVFLAVAMFHGIRHGMPTSATLAWIPNLFHVQNFVAVNNHGAGMLLAHTWSLAVEEHFYLALPLILCILLSRKLLHVLPWLAISVGIGCLLLRITCYINGVTDSHSYAQTQFRADALSFGVLLAYLYQFRQTTFQMISHRPKLAFIGGFALISPLILLSKDYSWFRLTIGSTLLYLGYGLMICGATNIQKLRGPITNGLAFLGFYSYSIYLWHIFAQPIMYQYFPRPQFVPGFVYWMLWTIGYIAVAVSIGVLASKVIEQPFLRLRDKLTP